MLRNQNCRLWLLVAGLLAVSPCVLFAQDNPAKPITGTIAGRVVDADGKAAANAVVFVCGQETGMPVGSKTRSVLTHERFHGEHEQPLWVKTDDAGRFSFEDIHAGTYRVFAQSWGSPFEDAFELNGVTVDLLGSADNLRVPSDEAGEVDLKPAGTGSLVFPGRSVNDDFYAFVSTEYPGDAVLGFLGWEAPFGNHVIGFNRMKAGRTTFRGLPDGKVGYTVFANDNNPGLAAGRGTISPDRRSLTGTSAEEDMIAGWSNARYTPEPELRPVFAHVKGMVEAGKLSEIAGALSRGTEAEGKLELKKIGDLHQREILPRLRQIGPLERKIELPGYGPATVNETLASLSYLWVERVYADRVARQRERQKKSVTPPDEN